MPPASPRAPRDPLAFLVLLEAAGDDLHRVVASLSGEDVVGAGAQMEGTAVADVGGGDLTHHGQIGQTGRDVCGGPAAVAGEDDPLDTPPGLGQVLVAVDGPRPALATSLVSELVSWAAWLRTTET